MATREGLRQWKSENPYKAWIYRSDGSKFIGHFKNQADAADYQNRIGGHQMKPVGSTPKPRRRQAARRSYSGFGSFGGGRGGFW